MKMKMEQAEKEVCNYFPSTMAVVQYNIYKITVTRPQAAEKAQEQAEIQRMKDQAKFHEEMERRKNMEDQLRAQVCNHHMRSPCVLSIIYYASCIAGFKVLHD